MSIIMKKRSIHPFLTFLCLTSLMLSLWWGEVSVFAQSNNSNDLVKQGVTQYQKGEYTKAIATWQQALNSEETKNNVKNQAIIQENLARTYQKIGQTEQEIDYWQKAIINYQKLNQIQQVGRLLTEQAQAYSRLGKYQKSLTLLCSPEDKSNTLICDPNSALEIAKTYQDKEGKIAALGSLGEVYRLMGNYERAIDILENEALNQAQNLDNLTYSASLFKSLGNVYFAQAKRWQIQASSAEVRSANNTAEQFRKNAVENSQLAFSNYQSAFKLNQQNNNPSEELQTLLNLVQLNQQFPNLNYVDNYQKTALNLLNQIPKSSAKIYAAINLAIASPFSECPIVSSLSNSQIETTLQEAVENANQLKSPRINSFALGALGHFYECESQYNKALKLTKDALLLAEQNRVADDSLYLWEWQLGRILEALKQPSEAIAAYERAYGILESLRSDILTANRDLQFDFRDSIEPLYRQLIQLILGQENSSPNPLSQPFIKGLQTLDSLKLAELQNYLGDAFNN